MTGDSYAFCIMYYFYCTSVCDYTRLMQLACLILVLPDVQVIGRPHHES